MVRLPLVVRTMSQLPVPNTAGVVQVSVPPLTVTVTLPVAVPAPAPVGASVHWTVTDWPTTDGSSGPSEVMVRLVLALFTVWMTAVDTLPAKFTSPLYVAVTFLAPTEVKIWPAPPVPALIPPVQLSVPSDTVAYRRSCARGNDVDVVVEGLWLAEADGPDGDFDVMLIDVLAWATSNGCWSCSPPPRAVSAMPCRPYCGRC
jgi:hypothetical protein